MRHKPHGDNRKPNVSDEVQQLVLLQYNDLQGPRLICRGVGPRQTVTIPNKSEFLRLHQFPIIRSSIFCRKMKPCRTKTGARGHWWLWVLSWNWRVKVEQCSSLAINPAWIGALHLVIPLFEVALSLKRFFLLVNLSKQLKIL